MLARNGVSECELLKLIPITWSDWLNLSDALHHSGIIVTRMGLMSLANKQVSCYPIRGDAVASWFSWCTCLWIGWSGLELWLGIMHCVLEQDTSFTVPLSSQMYKWVPANLMLGLTL